MSAISKDAAVLRAQKLATRRKIEEALERRRFREEFGDEMRF